MLLLHVSSPPPFCFLCQPVKAFKRLHAVLRMVVDAEEQSGHGGYWAAVGPLVEAFVTRHEADDEAVFRYERGSSVRVSSTSPWGRLSVVPSHKRRMEGLVCRLSIIFNPILGDGWWQSVRSRRRVSSQGAWRRAGDAERAGPAFNGWGRGRRVARRVQPSRRDPQGREGEGAMATT